jgi:TonB family protein
MKPLAAWMLLVGPMFGQGDSLPAPMLLAPAENAEVRKLPRDVVFEWSAVPGAESYTLEIDCERCCATDRYCSEVAPDRVTRMRDLQSTKFRYESLADSRVRWRVWAIKGFLESDKAPWRTLSFITGGAPSPPQAPQTLSPATGATIPPETPSVTLEWSPVAGAKSYVVEVDRIATCMTGRWCSDLGVYNLTEDIEATKYSLNVSNPFMMRWRVWALAGERASLKSPWSQFLHTELVAPAPRPNAASPTNPPAAPGANPAVAPPGRATVATRVDPEYSTEARNAKLEGVVTVYYEVDTNGHPRNVKAIRGLGLGLDENAVEAVKQWRFNPTPSISLESVDLNFNLSPPGEWSLRHTAYTVIREDQQDSNIDKPVLSHYAQPAPAACPEGARTLVTAYFHIDKKGVPSEVRVGSTPAAAAIGDAVLSWRFKPARSSGNARAADGVFTLVCNGGPAAVAAPSRVGGGVSQPSVISQVTPEYSEAARKAKAQGDVQLQLIVDADGFATDIHVVRPLGLGLDEKAVEALAQWRFNPGMSDRKPVPVFAVIQTSFRLL